MDCRTASSSSTIPIRGAMISSGFLSEEIEYCCRNISSVRQLCHSFSGDTAEQLGPSFENSSYPPMATQHERARTRTEPLNSFLRKVRVSAIANRANLLTSAGARIQFEAQMMRPTP